MNFKNNKNYKKFPFMNNKKEIIDKNLFDTNLLINNDKKEIRLLGCEKNSKLLSFTEQSQKIQPKQLFNKRLPKLYYNKNMINNFISQIKQNL